MNLGMARADGSVALDPLFDVDVTEYTAEVEGDRNITINADASYPYATVKVAKTMIIADETLDLPRGGTSDPIELDSETTTTLVIQVTAEDGMTTREYTIAVKHLLSSDDRLKSLGIASASGNIALDPVFASTRTEYTAEVEGDVSITINAETTYPQATIQIAKTMIGESAPRFEERSASAASAEIDLNLDTTTTVVIRVTAEDGEAMEEYTS